ncbi:MAG: thiamine phosphate synthase [Bacteroidota bacterium]
MLILISNPTPVTKEAFLINQLFDEGLAIFHLRKPDSSTQELVLLLQEINPIHYSKIALHSHHYLAKSFGINRQHYTEAGLKQVSEVNLSEQKLENKLSTSVHSILDFKKIPDYFDYAFLSPVFNSISKPNYTAQEFDLTDIDKKSTTKLIALGGINETNCHMALDMGFDGIALLGSIWNSENKIKAFKTIQSVCSTIAQ